MSSACCTRQCKLQLGASPFARRQTLPHLPCHTQAVPASPLSVLDDLDLTYERCAGAGMCCTAVAVMASRAAAAGSVDWRSTRDREGNTLIMSAAAAPGDGGGPLCAALAAGGVDINAAGAEGDTALFLAARAGNLAVCRELVQAGADVLQRNARNRTASSQINLKSGSVRADLESAEAVAKAAREERVKALFDAKMRSTQTSSACVLRAV